MKKIINKPETVVMEMCNGILAAHPELAFNPNYKVLKKKKINQRKVTLISGGGCGHEPAHAGFIGKGMLDAAVCGDVFASPSQIQVYQAIKETKSEAGTLLLVKNYSGDIMNFKNAMHLASEDGIEVDYVKIDDDIAVEDSLYTVGRRGVAGTLFVHKMAGAAAEQGKSLSEVKVVANKTIANVRSIGFALTSCTVPAKGTPTFDLEEDKLEYGVGIHGEPGIKRESILSADELADRMIIALLKDLKIEDNSSEEIAVLVNGFGGSPLQELYLLNNSVNKALASHGINAYKTFVGNYMTSIDMAGASISILKLDEELSELLAKDCDTPAFKISDFTPNEKFEEQKADVKEDGEVSYTVETKEEYSQIKDEVLTIQNVEYMIDVMCESAIRNEIPFCELDSHAGDGDFGMSIAKGFRELKQQWHKATANQEQSIGEFLSVCSLIIMEYCGGASGPIWGSAFRAAGRYSADKKELTLEEFANMMAVALKGIQDTGERSFGRGAVVGDKTLVDALSPCIDALMEGAKNNSSYKEALNAGAVAAKEGALSTEKIVARMGRAGTVGERSIGHPDAGAYGLGVIFTDISESMK